jgi:hypothetical protein
MFSVFPDSTALPELDKPSAAPGLEHALKGGKVTRERVQQIIDEELERVSKVTDADLLEHDQQEGLVRDHVRRQLEAARADRLRGGARSAADEASAMKQIADKKGFLTMPGNPGAPNGNG